MLGILSLLNWLMAALYVAALVVVWIVVGDRMPFDAFALVAMMLLLMALPSAYLGYATELGRGRIAQTIFAVASLCSFPLGTAYGAFALWVVWSAEAAVFDRGGVEVPETRGRLARQEDPPPDEERADSANTPYAIAKRLQRRGVSAGEIQERLHEEGSTAEEIKTVLEALGLRFSRLKQKSLDERS